MEGNSIQKGARKKDWVLTQHTFRQFLSWLFEGDSGGEKYLEMRRRLVAYFHPNETRGVSSGAPVGFGPVGVCAPGIRKKLGRAMKYFSENVLSQWKTQ